MKPPLRIVSLFAGVGGVDIGFERAGMVTVAQVEIDEHARKVLAQHWPTVPCVVDVRDAGAHNLPACDVVAGGYPCLGHSPAGTRRGFEDPRSALWSEFARVVAELRPRYVVVENSPRILSPVRECGRVVAPAPIGRILGDLAPLGYDAEWDCFPAGAFGAPHLRDRCFVVAYRQEFGRRERWPRGPAQRAKGDADARPQGAPRVFSLPVRRSTWWDNEPRLERLVYGVSGRPHEHRHRLIGNVVVPQVAEHVGRCVVAHWEATS